MLRAQQVIAHRCGSAIYGQLEHSFLRKSRYTTVPNVDGEQVDVAIVGGGPAGLADRKSVV